MKTRLLLCTAFVALVSPWIAFGQACPDGTTCTYKYRGSLYDTLEAAEAAMRAFELAQNPARAFLEASDEERLSGGLIRKHYAVAPQAPALETPNVFEGNLPFAPRRVQCPQGAIWSCDTLGQTVARMIEEIERPPARCNASVNANDRRILGMFGGRHEGETGVVFPQPENHFHLYFLSYAFIQYTHDTTDNGVCDGTVQTFQGIPQTNKYGVDEFQNGNCPAGFNPQQYPRLDFAPATGGPYVYCYADDEDFIDLVPNNYCPSDHEGNPCSPVTGNKLLRERDFSGGTLAFSRRYNSLRDASHGGDMGVGWTHNHQWRLLNISGSASTALLIDNRGHWRRFSKVNADYFQGVDTDDQLRRINAQWQLWDGDQRITFDADGRPERILRTGGAWQDLTLTYNADDQLARVEDVSTGRALDFVYEFGRIVEVRQNDVAVASYSYSSEGNLTTVTYPDASTRSYEYTATGFPHHLTAVRDETGGVFATYTYDARGRVTSSEHAGGAGRVTLDYQPGQTIVTRPLGETVTYDLGWEGYPVVDAIADGHGNSSRSYDIDGRLAATTDANGTIVQYDYDAEGNRIRRIEAVGTPEQRTLETDWTNGLRTEERLRDAANAVVSRTTFAYNADGQMTQRTEIDPATLAQRSWSYTYCTATDVGQGTCPVAGQLRVVNGPRTDKNDLTRYVYRTSDHPSCASGVGSCTYRLGDLEYVRNQLGHLARTVSYDAVGRTTILRDANNVSTYLTYSPRGWLISSQTGQETTTYDYTAWGDIERVTQPSGAYLDYEYDAAHRIIAVENNAGDRIEYTLDAAGHRIAEDTYDPTNALKRSMDRVYNQLGQLTQLINGVGDAITFGYDADDNRDAVTDGRNLTTDFAFDALDRLKKQIDPQQPVRGETTYSYDARGNMVSATDANGNTTSYVYDGLNNLVSQTSPDTGTTTYTYDAAGNRTQMTDARSVTVNYSYDALNRLTLVDYSGTALDVTYTYDAGTYGKGRLTGMSDASGSSNWTYDLHGRVTQKVQTIDGHSFTITNAYEATTGRLVSVTYPSTGTLAIAYQSGAPDRVDSLTWAGETFLSNVGYDAFGQPLSWSWRSGQYTISTDAAGRIDALTSLGYALGYDDAGNLHQLQTATQTWDYAYDNANRLSSQTDDSPQLLASYGYDLNGNRTSEQQYDGSALQSRTLNYTANSNRLASASAGPGSGGQPFGGPVSYTRDAVGNRIADGTHTYAYDERNRLTGVDGYWQYEYNGRGERVKKANGQTTYFIYDDAGRLIGEYDANGNALLEHVHFARGPVAAIYRHDSFIQPLNHIYNVVHDHLGTPRLITNSSGTTVWAWALTGDPFGNHPAVETAQAPNNFNYNLRYPGQYFDAETNQHYNYFRDYDPGLGRYVQSDPIGLWGGFATYLYASANPILLRDPYGLFVLDPNCEDCDFSKEEIEQEIRRACEVGTEALQPAVRRCVRDRCESRAKVKCDGGRCSDPELLGYYSSNDLFGGITICINNNDDLASVGTTAIHEWCHSCGVSHADEEYNDPLHPENLRWRRSGCPM